MRYERFIAHKFLNRKEKNFTLPLINIATTTIALGVLVMVMSLCILRGFQSTISDKVVGFGSHIVVKSYGWVNDYDDMPVELSDNEIATLRGIKDVDNVQRFAHKGGMIKTSDQIQGIIFKGIDTGYDTTFFHNNMVYGRMPNIKDTLMTNEVVVSQRLSSRMGIDTGQKIRTYFWAGDTYRARAFTVVGVYNTDMNEFDDHFIVGDIRHAQRINGWNNNQSTGVEILTNDIDLLPGVVEQVRKSTRPDLLVTTIVDEQPALFAWLNLLNSNIILILVIMSVVCATSVVSALLIMIFERTSMIGILKMMGSTNKSIRKIFTIKASSIILKGILIGDAIALILCLVQDKTHLIRLDSESYSMPFVPVEMSAWYFAIISAVTFAICMLALLIPATYISHIQPAKSIRKE